jgi:hypothetical protein
VIKDIISAGLLFLVAATTSLAGTDEILVQFTVAIESADGSIVPDTFFAVGAPDANVAYDIKDVLHVPSPPGSHVRMLSSDTGVDLMKDFRPYDANLAHLFFPIQLLAYDTNDAGLEGTSQLKLKNPSALASVSSDTLIYMRRYDKDGTLAAYYDLKNPDNHSIEWQTTGASGLFANLELVIIDKCLAADINDSGRIDLKDFADMAEYWLLDAPAAGRDINGDLSFGLDDLEILAAEWLCDYHAEQ